MLDNTLLIESFDGDILREFKVSIIKLAFTKAAKIKPIDSQKALIPTFLKIKIEKKLPTTIG